MNGVQVFLVIVAALVAVAIFAMAIALVKVGVMKERSDEHDRK